MKRGTFSDCCRAVERKSGGTEERDKQEEIRQESPVICIFECVTKHPISLLSSQKETSQGILCFGYFQLLIPVSLRSKKNAAIGRRTSGQFAPQSLQAIGPVANAHLMQLRLDE